MSDPIPKTHIVDKYDKVQTAVLMNINNLLMDLNDRLESQLKSQENQLKIQENQMKLLVYI
jgi:hypothetical protein